MSEKANLDSSSKAKDLQDAQPGVNCWRDEELLVLRRDAAFPGECCAICSDPASPPARDYLLFWYPNWFGVIWILAFFLLSAILWTLTSLPKGHVLFYVLMGTVLMGTIIGKFFWDATIQVSLCASHQWDPSRKRAGIAVVAIAAGFAFAGWYLSQPFLTFLWSIIMVVFFLLSQSKPSFSAKKINKEYVWIKGCGEIFLASFPEIGGEEPAKRKNVE